MLPESLMQIGLTRDAHGDASSRYDLDRRARACQRLTRASISGQRWTIVKAGVPRIDRPNA